MNNLDHLTSSYSYHLPKELIALRPARPRESARLLVYKAETNEILHLKISDLPEVLPESSTLVFNQSRVFKCRLMGQKESGGKAEIFFLESCEPDKSIYQVLIKARGKRSVSEIFFSEKLRFEIKEKLEDGVFSLEVSCPDLLRKALDERGQIPLPPYIEREWDEADEKDYQTSYSKGEGSVAAPTAGLHFTPELLQKLTSTGVQKSFVTLHVGLGTFRPVKAPSIKDHIMHHESFHIDQENYELIRSSKKLIAVGTTSLRVLEGSRVQNYRPGSWASTDLFLYPGNPPQGISGLMTNFHLPESTLLMLVSSLIGREKALEIYNLAVKEKYRFFSYGDAMLILL